MRLKWSSPALADVDAIAAHIARDNPRAAAEVTADIHAAVTSLKQFPGKGRVGRVDGTRELVIVGSPYVVGYAVHDSVIHVLTVMHGAQEWPESFDLLRAGATANGD